MSRRTRSYIAFALCLAMLAGSGCKPIQPFYLGGDDDLAHYLEVATDLEYPDAHEASLAETVLAQTPFSLSNPQPRELWDMTVEEAIHISLHNSKVLKDIGGLTASLSLNAANPTLNVAVPSTRLRQSVLSPDSVRTVFGPALQETNVASTATQGVESALADFDAQFSTSMFWDRTSRPLNTTPNPFFSGINRQDLATFQTEIAKRTAPGTQVAFRNNMTYTEPISNPNKALNSDWLANFEVEARQPLMRGRGTQVNRVPIVLARVRDDISLADFQCAVRDHVYDVETAYWELYFAYRNLEARKTQRDSIERVWQIAKSKQEAGLTGGASQDEAKARQRYFLSVRDVQVALSDLFSAENRLRFMMGLTPTDGRLIRPVDEPLTARVEFDWNTVLSEALCRSCELRIKRWQIKQREMELLAARNQLLPQLDAVALYRWLGRGDELLNYQNGPNFPDIDSDAYEELFDGDFQEWRLGFELTLPVGFRRELAGVRHAQLQLARERALLQETELELTHQLTDTMQKIDAWYRLAETAFNRRVATEMEVKGFMAVVEGGLGQGSQPLLDLLDALQENADAQASFHRDVVNYTTSILYLHANKGSLLEQYNIVLAEGPWPEKAYYDAQHLARQRAAGTYMNYGYTRPKVISRGAYEQFQHGGPVGAGLPDSEAGAAETIETPPAAPLPDDQSGAAGLPDASRVQQASAVAPIETVKVVAAAAAEPPRSVLIGQQHSDAAPGGVEIRVRKGAKFDWGSMGGLNP